MDHHISDEQLDRAVIRVLADRGDEIEASGIAPSMAAARVRMMRTAVLPSRLVWVGLLALLAVAMLVATWAAVGQKPSLPLTFAPGSIAFARGGDLFVAAPDGSDERLVDRADATADGTIYDAAFAPDGRSIAFSEDGGRKRQRVVTVSASGERLGSFAAVSVIGFDWAPDGERLAIMTAGGLTPKTVALVGLDGRTVLTLSLPDGFGRPTSGGDTGPSWSPDRRWLAVMGCQHPCDQKFETHILLVAADGSGYRWLTNDRALQDYSMAWSADSRIAIGRFGKDRRMVDVMSTDGTLLREVTLPNDGGPERLAWSPDGMTLAVEASGLAVEASGLVTIAADGVPTVVPMTMHPARGPGLRGWSQDGRELLFSTWTDGGPTLWWAVDASGGTPRQMFDDIDPLDIFGPVP